MRVLRWAHDSGIALTAAATAPAVLILLPLYSALHISVVQHTVDYLGSVILPVRHCHVTVGEHKHAAASSPLFVLLSSDECAGVDQLASGYCVSPSTPALSNAQLSNN